jgi:hypothetical protein
MRHTITGAFAALALSVSTAGAVTFNENGLDWFAGGSQTYGLSGFQVAGKLVEGGDLQDYRFATLTEVDQLLQTRYNELFDPEFQQTDVSRAVVLELLSDFGLSETEGLAFTARDGAEEKFWIGLASNDLDDSQPYISSYFYVAPEGRTCTISFEDVTEVLPCSGGLRGFFYEDGVVDADGYFSFLVLDPNKSGGTDDDLPAVPLPASLPLLLAGLGAVGALASRRRRP